MHRGANAGQGIGQAHYQRTRRDGDVKGSPALGAAEGLTAIKYGGDLGSLGRGLDAWIILRRGNELSLAIEDGHFGTGSGCVQTDNPGQGTWIGGSRTGATQMYRQQAGFAHQGLLRLLAQRLFHDLAQGEFEDRHPQEKDQYEGEE
jgi:hypothetical protein